MDSNPCQRVPSQARYHWAVPLSILFPLIAPYLCRLHRAFQSAFTTSRVVYECRLNVASESLGCRAPTTLDWSDQSRRPATENALTGRTAPLASAEAECALEYSEGRSAVARVLTGTLVLFALNRDASIKTSRRGLMRSTQIMTHTMAQPYCTCTDTVHICITCTVHTISRY